MVKKRESFKEQKHSAIGGKCTDHRSKQHLAALITLSWTENNLKKMFDCHVGWNMFDFFWLQNINLVISIDPPANHRYYLIIKCDLDLYQSLVTGGHDYLLVFWTPL